MKGLQLLATGGALPSRVVTNEDLRRQVDTSDEWITTRTGICQRYYCTENEDAATLAITAARQALTRSVWRQTTLPAVLWQRSRPRRLPQALPAAYRLPWVCRKTGLPLM